MEVTPGAGRVGCSGYYSAGDNETPRQIAARTGTDVHTLVAMNSVVHSNIKGNSRLMSGTLVRVPGWDQHGDKLWLSTSDAKYDPTEAELVSVCSIDTTPFACSRESQI